VELMSSLSESRLKLPRRFRSPGRQRLSMPSCANCCRFKTNRWHCSPRSKPMCSAWLTGHGVPATAIYERPPILTEALNR
jgi:hypothetical protein